MNLLIGVLIIVCLAGSEFVSPQPVDDVLPRLVAVLITMALVPGLACFQTIALLRRMRDDDLPREGKQAMCRRLTLSHGCFWLAASLAIIWAIRWQDVVRGTWNLDQFPLIDEVLILLPMVVSLVASWLVFFELQTALAESESGAKKRQTRPPFWRSIVNSFAARREFISIRFRLYFLLVLIPVGVFVFLRDTLSLMSDIPPWLALGLTVLGLVSLIVFFPRLILLIWRNDRMENEDLEDRLLEICRVEKIRVTGIRVWRTGSQIVNAVVVGLVPRFRTILVSDGLLTQFSEDEIAAVVRHEAGHIRLWHVPTRMLFMLLPLLGLAVGNPEILDLDQSNLYYCGIAYAVVLLFYGLYLHVVVRWISHQMELEADMFSIQSTGLRHQAIDPDQSASMTSALLRLAAYAGDEMDRSTLFHPSLQRRLEFIDDVRSNPGMASRFQLSFQRRRRIVGATVIAASLVVAILA